MTTDNSDVTTRLRQTRADMIGTDDEQHYWDCHEAAAEIERLREAIRRLAEQDATLSVCDGNVTVEMDATLTDNERQAIREAADAYEENNGDPDCERIADTLHGLLDRLSPIAAGDNDRSEAIAADCPDQDNAPKQDTTPEWMARPFWVDPPAGHRYGFPKLYDPNADGDMTAWMIANGYPQRLADKGLACTFTATTE